MARTERKTNDLRKWQSKRGTKPAWSIYCGDARRILGKFRESSFDCVITSPPYYWQRDYKVKGQLGLERSVQEYVDSIVSVMSRVRIVLANDGLLFLNLGDTYYSGKGQPRGVDAKHSARRMTVLRAVDASGLGFPQKSLLGLPWRIANKMVDDGWTLRSSIIWQRSKPLPEANVLDRPWRTYEFVFLFSKARRYRFDRRELVRSQEEDVWTIDSRTVPGRTHPAAFPIALVDRCLALAKLRKNATVLDPFAGSCTVLDAAIRRRKSATGIDLNPAFCRTAAARLSKL